MFYLRLSETHYYDEMNKSISDSFCYKTYELAMEGMKKSHRAFKQAWIVEHLEGGTWRDVSSFHKKYGDWIMNDFC